MRNFISFAIASLLLIVFNGQVSATHISVQDTIASDVTWSADTVKVTGHITILDDVILTVQPGTRIEFQGHYGFNILGTLLADGTPGDKIVFTIPLSDTTGFSNWAVHDGSWAGLLFNNTPNGGADGAMSDNDSTRIDHCIIEFTKSINGDDYFGSGIEVVDFSRLVISNSEFRNNKSHRYGGAIRAFTNSDIVIRDNHIHHNTAFRRGGAIYLHNSDSWIKGNLIEHNRVINKDPDQNRAHGGGFFIIGSKPIIENNIIRYNSAVVGAAIDLVNSIAIIKHNTIVYNSGTTDLPVNVSSQGGAISIRQGSSPRIINNAITNNKADAGGGIVIMDSDPFIISNLILNNTATITSGGIFSLWSTEIIINNTIAHNKAPIGAAMELQDSEPVFMNNIVWNNLQPSGFQIKLLGYFVKFHAVNSIIENGGLTFEGESSPTFTNLILEDPGFIKPSLGEGADFEGLEGFDWTVGTSSPCINAGNLQTGQYPIPEKDFFGGERIHHSIIDIGAHEVVISRISAQDTITQNTTWVADTVHLTDDLVIADNITLTILPGTWVLADGRFQIDVIGTILAIGTEKKPIYFLPADTTGNSDKSIPDGSWRGIIIDNERVNNAMADNDPSILSHCNIGFIKSMDGEAFQHCALAVNMFSGLTLSNCTFFDNYAFHEPASLFLRQSDIDITGCRFINNHSNQGSAIWTENSDFSIDQCYFENNHANDRGGAVNSSGGSIIISNSEFYYNSSGWRGGAVLLQRTEAKINHNHFVNNYASDFGGAVCVMYDNYLLTNNIITNNTGNAGGGVYGLYVDEAVSINNTICNNFAMNGGGMYGAFVNHTSINDILYGNDVEYDGKQYGMYSVSATINFTNTNIEGGTEGIGFWQGQELTGTYTNIMDSLPEFIRPSDGPGNEFDGTNSRWILKSISPCINNGTNQGTPLLDDEDIRGNPRVFDSIIDIGAVESQYGLPELKFQPDNYIGCAGDTVNLRVRARFQSFYQWQKDGKDLIGANDKDLILENINSEDDGNYLCIVSNSFGAVRTNPVYLLARAAPEFIRQPEDIWATEGEKTIISTSSNGDQPIHFQWFKNGEAMPNKTWPDLWIPNTDSINEGMYYCEAANVCGTLSSNTVELFIAPQICMVTVDTAEDGNNLIIWEKNSVAPIASYNIYRESIVAGQYDAIGNVAGSALSEFTDTEVDPAQQAHIYKLTAVMADGRESDINLCKPHRTIHLLTSKNIENNVAQLDWDDYYGFEYGTFFIFRNDADRGEFSNYFSMSSSTNEWTDIDAEPGALYYYRVAVEPPRPCNPKGGDTKAGTGPYYHSLSNMDDNKLKLGVDDVVFGGLKIYPNPVSQRCTVEFPNPELSEYRVTIRDLTGKVVRMENTSGTSLLIEKGDMEAGIYSIELSGKKIYRDKFVVK